MLRLTVTFEALFIETPQHTATVVTEGGAPVVVTLEAMWHVNLEALFLKLHVKHIKQPPLDKNENYKYKLTSPIIQC